MKTFDLKNGNKIPTMGLGTWKLAGKTCEGAVEIALDEGYRHIDTAEIYGNQQEIGNVLSRTSVKREDIFVTSKVWRSNLSKEETLDSAKQTLEALQTDYVDLLLIHWPNDVIPLDETFDAMALLKEQGLVKNYGVSNFNIARLDTARDFEVVVNQVEFHPTLNQHELKEYCDKQNIIITAYSPLAQGQDLKLKEVESLANKYEVSTAQVVLNWLVSKGIVAIPRSGDEDHIRDNLKALDWELEDEDVRLLDKLDEGNRIVNPGFADF